MPHGYPVAAHTTCPQILKDPVAFPGTDGLSYF